MSTTVRPRPHPTRRHILGISVGFGLTYGLTATWGLDANVDAIAAALPAWSAATSGGIALDDFARANPWTLDSEFGLVSNRPPGVWLIAVPAYLLARPEVFTNIPATATAIAATVAALVVLYLVLCRLIPNTAALAATVVFGAGTSTWQVSADALWPHGPGQLWAALGLMALASQSPLRAGWAMAAALLTRPVTAVHAAVVGGIEGWRSRSVQPVIAIGVPASIGLLCLLAYNWSVFGAVSISGGYPTSFTDRLASEPAANHLVSVFAFFVSPNNGLFIWSPVVFVAGLGVFWAWSSAPGWARSAAVAALLYIVLHARLNRVSGGIPFGYRYPLEPLMLAAPLLVLGARELWVRGAAWQRAIVFSSALSIVFQVLLVATLDCHDVGGELASCGFFRSID